MNGRQARKLRMMANLDMQDYRDTKSYNHIATKKYIVPNLQNSKKPIEIQRYQVVHKHDSKVLYKNLKKEIK